MWEQQGNAYWPCSTVVISIVLQSDNVQYMFQSNTTSTGTNISRAKRQSRPKQFEYYQSHPAPFRPFPPLRRIRYYTYTITYLVPGTSQYQYIFYYEVENEAVFSLWQRKNPLHCGLRTGCPYWSIVYNTYVCELYVCCLSFRYNCRRFTLSRHLYV